MSDQQKSWKRILVVGAGSSGLTAIKCCVDEGLQPVCYERTDEIGGLWHYTDGVHDGQACVMKSTTINTSKEMMSYSDFPVPSEQPNFMHNSSVWKYFKSYVEHFDLKRYIHFNKEIMSVRKSDNFETHGQWNVEVRDVLNDDVISEIFDGVMICTGHHAEKRMPNFPGEENFKGKILHSHDYKVPTGYENKRIVMVGMGNSSGDAAVELSRVTSQLYLSTRRGSWVVNRIGDRGLPADLLIANRFGQTMAKLFGPNKINEIVEKQANKRLDHQLYKIKPQHHFTEQHPMVNDDLPNRIATGSIIMKPNIKKILANGVEFEDGTVVEDIDVIMYATGYIFGFPFLDKQVVDVVDNEVNLYKYMFPPEVHPPTLAIIGCVQPIGSTIPIAEIQSRWASRVLKGTSKLPSTEDMWNDIQTKKTAMVQRYVKTPRHTIQVDWIPYMDEIAEGIGCKPDISKLLFSDPKLAFQVYFGPCSPVQYRIMGPGKWDKARDILLNLWDRVYEPFHSKPLKEGSTLPWFYIVTVVAAAFIIKLIWF